MNTYIHITYIHITYKHTCIYLYIYTYKLEERWLSAKRGRKAPGSDTGGLREWQYCSKFHAMVCRGMAYLHRRVPRRAVSLWESQVPLRERQGGNEGKHLLKRTIFSFSSLWWLILCVSRRLCLDEINIYIGEWWISKLLLWWEWASSNQFNAWIEQKNPVSSWARVNSPADGFGCLTPLVSWVSCPATQTADSGLVRPHQCMSQLLKRNLFVYTAYWFSFSGELLTLSEFSCVVFDTTSIYGEMGDWGVCS